MPVLPEEKLIHYLERCLKICQSILPLIPAKGTEKAVGPEYEAFKELVEDLKREREKDSYLSDEAWNWIWKGKPSYTYIQLYGRLAWIHYELFQLL